MKQYSKIALGGSCHWCTEAIFLSLKGVQSVEQGFVSATGDDTSFSEAIIVHYNPNEISLKDIIAIHLHTHRSTENHSMRNKYRSAIYAFSTEDSIESNIILKNLQQGFNQKLITKVYRYKAFKSSDKMFHNYYYSNPEKPFCRSYIAPKLKVLLDTFSKQVNINKLKV